MTQRVPVLPDAWPADPVVLQRRRLSDVPDVLAAIGASITELGAFLRWAAAGVPSLVQFERTVAARDADFVAGTGFEYVLRECSTGQIVGGAGGDLSLNREAVEIGYWVRSDRTGRGYATAAATALTSLSFDVFADIGRVEVRMDDGNGASRLIATRLGFTRIGGETFEDPRLSGQTGEGHIYAMTRCEWASRRLRNGR
jgi:ribosomal-protein-serine acetyltransferase